MVIADVLSYPWTELAISKKGRGYPKNSPKNNIRFLQFSVLLHPSRKTLTHPWILIWKFSAREALFRVELGHPQIVFEKCRSSQELGIRTSKWETVGARH